MLALALALTVQAAPPTHPVCGGIPGGMYDDVARIGDALSVTMHRYIMDDADANHLGAVFFNGDGQTLKRWRGDYTKAFFAEKSGTWVYRAEVALPEGAARVRLFDLHHERACEIALPLEGGVTIEKIERTGKHDNPDLPDVVEIPTFEDETLEGDAVDVKRGRKARLAARDLEEPPANLEQRAMLLAKLKQNLPRMKRQQVLDWMGHQGFEPDDVDVIETLGPDWLAKVGE